MIKLVSFILTNLAPSRKMRNLFGNMSALHDDVIKWKHFPRNWPFLRGIHRSHYNATVMELLVTVKPRIEVTPKETMKLLITAPSTSSFSTYHLASIYNWSTYPK